MLLPYGGWFAVGLTSFLFAILHAQPGQIPSIFLLSMVLGYAAEATGSLRLPMLLHFVNNATALAVRWLTLNLDAASALAFFGVLFSGYLVAGLFALPALWGGKLPPLPPKKDGSRLTRAERVLSAPVFLLGVAAALLPAVLHWGGA